MEVLVMAVRRMSQRDLVRRQRVANFNARALNEGVRASRRMQGRAVRMGARG